MKSVGVTLQRTLQKTLQKILQKTAKTVKVNHLRTSVPIIYTNQSVGNIVC